MLAIMPCFLTGIKEAEVDALFLASTFPSSAAWGWWWHPGKNVFKKLKLTVCNRVVTEEKTSLWTNTEEKSAAIKMSACLNLILCGYCNKLWR